MSMLNEVKGNIVVTIPMYFRNVCGKKQMVLRDELKTLDGDNLNDNAIVAAFARARAWMKLLESGEVATVKDLAERMNVDRPYIVRTLRLASLSPRILQAVLHGFAPDGLTVEKLWAIKSDDWSEQEREAGFTKIS